MDRTAQEQDSGESKLFLKGWGASIALLISTGKVELAYPIQIYKRLLVFSFALAVVQFALSLLGVNTWSVDLFRLVGALGGALLLVYSIYLFYLLPDAKNQEADAGGPIDAQA